MTGTLTFTCPLVLQGNVLFTIDKSTAQTNNQIVCTGAITNGGTLTVSNAPGTTF